MADQSDGPQSTEPEPSLPFGSESQPPTAAAPEHESEALAEAAEAEGVSESQASAPDGSQTGPGDETEPDDDSGAASDAESQPSTAIAIEADAHPESELDDEPESDPETKSQPMGEAAFEIEVLTDVETDPVTELAVADIAAAGDDATDAEHLDSLSKGPTTLDDFSHGDYTAATTVEYQGLADAIEAADREDTQLQAVAVTMPGLESGVVGFEDVTGEQDQVVRTETPGAGSDLGIRIVSGLVLMGMLIAALWAGGLWFVAFVSLMALIALGELYSALRMAGHQPVALIGFLSTVAMMVAGFRYGPFGIVGWFTVGIVAVFIWYAVLVRRDPLANASVTILGFAWVGALLSFIAPIAATEPFRQLVLAVVLVTASLDVGSYFAGRAFGRHKMSPNLSPNKTYEGLMGGIVLATGMAIGLSFVEWFAPLDLRGALFLAGIVVTLGPFGDLAVSMLKRQVGVKDMGSILPGHGGVLDRIDALLFIIPAAYFVFSWLGYFS